MLLGIYVILGQISNVFKINVDDDNDENETYNIYWSEQENKNIFPKQ